MAVRAATFTGFDPYKLTGVQLTDRKLGHGSYATVLELEYMGLKCAGKKIHELLLEQGDASYTVRRFEEECRLLSQIRHPNIVQFLGVYFQQGTQAPILVMEFLPTNLSTCIEQYGILPKEISYSILHDVALGLCYLHSQTSPIIHRDLSSNNVLLTPNMTAKISDLGVARILNLTPLQMSNMTQTPGTPTYMPPEVMVANPKYDTSVDVFSYGIMMIHMFSGRWPEPQVGPNRTEAGTMIPVSEAERREVFLQVIGSNNPLMKLIHKCIDNDPEIRPCVTDIAEHLLQLTQKLLPSFVNCLELLQQIDVQNKEKKEIERKMLVQSILIKELQLHICDARTQCQLQKDEFEAKIAELKDEGFLDAIKDKIKILQKELKDFKAQLKSEQNNSEKQLCTQREQFRKWMDEERNQHDERIALERDIATKLMEKNHDLESTVSKLKKYIEDTDLQISALKSTIAKKDKTIQTRDSTRRLEKIHSEAKTRALKEKDSTIAEMSKQVIKATEYIICQKQIQLSKFIWKKCTRMPASMGEKNLQSVVINNKVYYREKQEIDHDPIICYDQSQDKWTTLPSLPVRLFGLGQVNGKLVTVGGKICGSNNESNELHTYDEHSQKWYQTIPSMPTARSSPGVLSLQSALVVAGGRFSQTSSGLLSRIFVIPDLDTVEIYKPDTSQWYRTDPLPTACRDISLVAIGNTCYALGGHNYSSYLNQALCASIDDLLGNAVPANQTTHSGSSGTHSAWKTLPNTPTYQPVAAVLGDNLLAIKVCEQKLIRRVPSGIYMYVSFTKSWIYIGSLPERHCHDAVSNLTPVEILVIGYESKVVYKGIPYCFN